MFEIARGYDRLAIDLEDHIARYVPGNCCESIGSFDHPPLFTAAHVKPLMDAHRNNTLGPTLIELGQQKSSPYNQIAPWYVKDAIKDFFAQEVYKSYVEELQS